MNWERTIITTDQAPAAVGPYSQAIRVGKLVFTAGQIGLDPATDNLVEGGIGAETRQVLHNIQAILASAGSNLSQVVKTTVYLADPGLFDEMNAVYAEFLSKSLPARATAAGELPKGALVEIDAIAVVP